MHAQSESQSHLSSKSSHLGHWRLAYYYKPHHANVFSSPLWILRMLIVEVRPSYSKNLQRHLYKDKGACWLLNSQCWYSELVDGFLAFLTNFQTHLSFCFWHLFLCWVFDLQFRHFGNTHHRALFLSILAVIYQNISSTSCDHAEVCNLLFFLKHNLSSFIGTLQRICNLSKSFKSF